VHPGDLAGGFSDLEMTWLLYCAGAATAHIEWEKASLRVAVRLYVCLSVRRNTDLSHTSL